MTMSLMMKLQGCASAGAAALSLAVAAAPVAHAWPAEATRELAVREGPGQEYPHIQVVPAGTVVDIRHCNVDRTWCKVDADGTVGYLRGQYLERIGDTYLGPRVDYYTTYRSRVWVGPPPRPYYRDYGGGHGYRRY
jgi:uncharacterized protein YraI